MLDYLYTLKNPSKDYRGHPFWSWNDQLDPEQLRWQIREMKKAGLGGYFMHARGGLKTEYLGKDWFDCIKAGIDEGKKEGMNAWSYDENGWPSGFGGGIVTAMGDKYHVRWLECTAAGEPFAGELIGIYAVSATNHYRYVGVDVEAAKNFVSSTEKLYFISHNKNAYYVDLLNPEVVKAFLDCTYEEYYKQTKADFGGSMVGFFTDEPQYSGGKIPWSYCMVEQFEKANNYSPIEHLICLFKEVQSAEKFRYEYWSVVSHLYTTSFGKQIFDWCNAHNCKWTGHVMAEDSLHSQMCYTAGSMPMYEYMHIPGMDWLCRHISSPVIPKQVGSAARQLGKRQVLSETFALTGWDVSFEELKWIAEWQYVNGINLMCQHLEGYSIRGLRKRDYPPSMFYQSPWWDDYKLFNDYFARLGKLLADGEEVVDVLLLHPMHSAWVAYDGTNNPRMNALDHDFVDVSNRLAGMHIPYHYGDETLMARHGKVEDGKLQVGDCVYSTVILPSLETIDESTALLLMKFLAGGGKIVSLGTTPIRINGKIDARIKTLTDRVDKCPLDKELMLHYFTKEKIKKVSVTDKQGEVERIHYSIRQFEDARAFFFVNLDKEKGYDVKIQIPDETQAVKFVLENMHVQSLDYLKKEDGITIYLHFEPMQSHLLLVGEDIPDPEKPQKPAMILPLSKQWTVEEVEENALTLDYCAYATSDIGSYSKAIPVLDVMDKLLAKQENSDISLKYQFCIAPETNLDTIKDLRMVLEYDSSFQITVNGREIQHDGVSWWKDKAFRAINIKDIAKIGINEIVIKGTFTQNKQVYDVLFGENVLETEINKLTYDTEIESIYIIGDFGVYSETGYTEGDRRALFTDGGFYITNRNITFNGGEIVTQGYPFFAGKIKMSQTIKVKKSYGKQIAVQFAKPYASLSKLYVNGKLVKILPWADYRVDVSDYVIRGEENTISVELIAGNRNLLGPHHHPNGELYEVATKSFGPNGNYDANHWRDRYCFVKIGMDE